MTLRVACTPSIPHACMRRTTAVSEGEKKNHNLMHMYTYMKKIFLEKSKKNNSLTNKIYNAHFINLYILLAFLYLGYLKRKNSRYASEIDVFKELWPADFRVTIYFLSLAQKPLLHWQILVRTPISATKYVAGCCTRDTNHFPCNQLNTS